MRQAEQDVARSRGSVTLRSQAAQHLEARDCAGEDREMRMTSRVQEERTGAHEATTAHRSARVESRAFLVRSELQTKSFSLRSQTGVD